MNMPLPEMNAARAADQTRFAALWRPALVQAFVKLDPRQLRRSPVMLVVALTALLTTVLCLMPNNGVSTGVAVQITVWLWFTVLFANFAEALAEGRGKARADSLKAGSQGLSAQRRLADGRFEIVAAGDLRKDDVVRVVAGDGEVLEGIAAVNEAAITGESAPVIRESGGDRSAVTGNTRVVSDWLLIRISSNPGESTLDRMIALVEGAKRQKTPNEIALDILLIGLTLIFLIVVVTLSDRGGHPAAVRPLQRRQPPVDLPRGLAGHADTHHHRRPVVGHRHRRYGPSGAPERHRPLRARGGGRR